MSLRWAYNHMNSEYSRHSGQADLLRQRIDGLPEREHRVVAGSPAIGSGVIQPWGERRLTSLPRRRGTAGRSDRLRWRLVRIGARGAVLPGAAILAAVLLVSGCRNGTQPAFHEVAGTPWSAPVSASSPALGTAEPKPTGGRTPAATPTRRPEPTRPGFTPAPLSLTLTEPFPPIQGRQITAIYQNLCGDPSRALVYVDVADPANISSVWYEYHVRTPIPFDGENRSPSVADNFRVWRGMIGPFDANPRNADGGPITVTAHGVYRDGSERTVTAIWTLKPCHH